MPAQASQLEVDTESFHHSLVLLSPLERIRAFAGSSIPCQRIRHTPKKRNVHAFIPSGQDNAYRRPSGLRLAHMSTSFEDQSVMQDCMVNTNSLYTVECQEVICAYLHIVFTLLVLEDPTVL